MVDTNEPETALSGRGGHRMLTKNQL